jgi:hypothetical protein
MSIPLGYHHITYPKLPMQQPFLRLLKIHYEPQSQQLPLGDVETGAYLEVEGQLTSAHQICEYICAETEGLQNLECMPTINVEMDCGRCPRPVLDRKDFLLRMAYLRDTPIAKEIFMILRLMAKSDHGIVAEIPCFTRIGLLTLTLSRGEDHASCLAGLRIEEEYQRLRLY